MSCVVIFIVSVQFLCTCSRLRVHCDGDGEQRVGLGDRRLTSIPTRSLEADEMLRNILPWSAGIWIQELIFGRTHT
jgi:hypothetical protein